MPMPISNTVTGWGSAAKLCGKSIATLRRLVAAGELAATQDEQGRHIFARSCLEALRDAGAAAGGGEDRPAGGNGSRPAPQPTARRTPLASELEHELYSGLAHGEPIEQLVLTLGLDPSWARQRLAAWMRLNGGVSVGERIDEVAGDVGVLRRRVAKLEEEVAFLHTEYQLAVVLIKGLQHRLFE